ncbi:MAG: GxxExxY protein [Chloroflexi bacterium]|nr:GxxExxY protein [Chloroflexota bacterium]
MSMLGNLKIVEQARPSAEELAKGEAGPKIAEAAFYVYSQLGPGLDESVYRECFYEELQYQGVPIARDVAFPMQFRGKTIEQAFSADFVVGDQAIVFVIAEEKTELHNLQIRSLLKLSGKDEAYIVNFRVADMRKGIMRATVQRGHILADQAGGKTAG